ncbi:integrase core domain-containing protein [Chloroflexota bacterium]
MSDRMACFESWFKQQTKPSGRGQVLNTLADLNRSKSELIAENMFLRQQLIILERQIERPKLTQRDRQILVLLASWIQGWREALVVVKPETLIGWHRSGFKLYWKQRSQARKGRPPTSPEIIALIEEMAVNNRTWRAGRIKGELLKLGIRLDKDTVKKYMNRARKGLPPRNQSQTWATFMKNHAGEMWACDFLQTYDLFFRVVFVYFIIELGSRRVVHYGVTRHPSDFWVAQQVRQATPYEEGPRFLIRDNDSKYGQCFNRVAEGRGIDVLRTPVRAPKANAKCERFIGSVRRECLDHMLILNERYLHRITGQYVAYFNHSRPHQGIDQRIPDPREADESREGECHGRIVGRPVLGGLHHDYRRVA